MLETNGAGGQLDGLKEAQKAAVEQLAERLRKTKIDGADGAEGEGLYDDALALVRYLRARNWDLDLAEALIRKTGTWRRDFGFSKIFTESMDEIAQEASFGNIYVRGYDKLGRPALYLKPCREGFNAEPAAVKYLVYCVERAIACVEKQAKLGQLRVPPEDPVARKFVLLVDFQGVGLGSLVPLTVRDLMVVMQDHYPERLGSAFFVNTPWLLHSFFTAASAFLDPVTLAKFNFVSEETSQTMEQHFDLSALENSFGGCDDEPFCSHIFLNTHSGEGVFGLEYSEQLRLSPQELNALQADHGFEYVEFLHVYRHWRVLRLPSQKRHWLRQLAKQLSLCEEEGMDYFIEASTLLRYLRAHEWDVDKAAAAVCATARWRKEHIPPLGDTQMGRCSAPIVRECALGRFYLRGFDKRGRPIVYVKFHHEDSGHFKETINYVIYVMERLIAVLRRKKESLQEKEVDGTADADCATVLVDFNGYSPSHRPPLRTLLEAMRIFQEHYPDVFGDIFLYRPPARLCFFYHAWQKMRCSSCLTFPIAPKGRSNVTLVTSASQWRKIAQSLFDYEKLEWTLGGNQRQPFTSKTFLSKKVDGAIFGTEFEAQAAAPEEKRQRVSFSSVVLKVEEAADTPAVIRHEPLEPEGIVSSTINTITWLFR